jgi:carbon starvation protein
MSLPLIAFLFIAGLAAAYVLYGRFIAAQYKLDPKTTTPAVELQDGADFVPTKPFYLLSQHFSAIAAAGPIVGPIAACGQFGWLPCLLWIGLGVVFIGAVHDFSALVASVRHKARSIAEIVKQNISRRAWLALLAFIWIALVYVIVAFTDVTAGTFLGKIDELEGVKVDFQSGGAVAFASIAYLLLAIAMGVVQKAWKNAPLWLMTLIFVPATLGVVWLGTKASGLLAMAPAAAGAWWTPGKMWGTLILAYCFVASMLPMWLLLQPRGYLGGFVLYIVLIVGTIGVFFGGFGITTPAWKGWNVGTAMDGALFPFLFVTIACGACSGFHGLVCSGTTSKQIEKEPDCRPIGYGGMLLEAFVALIALSTIMIGMKGANPGQLYANGIGEYLTVIIGKSNLLFAIVFGSMAFSTFVFDTLDSATRLGRYIVQELFDWRTRAGAALGTALTVGAPLFFVLTAKPGSWRLFWVLFGTSNQLLAALTLLGITVWLKRAGRACWYTFAPMCFVMVITVWALIRQAWAGFTTYRAADGTVNATVLINGSVAMLLLVLAAMVVAEAVVAVRKPSASAMDLTATI